MQRSYETIPADAARIRSGGLSWLLLLLIVVAAVGIRLLHLDADPPGWYIPGDVGLQVDEGYKTLDAKNRLVFGETHWNAGDDYPGWSKGSPFTQQSYYTAFKLLGLELSSARLVSVLLFTVFLCMVAVATQRYWGAGIALVTAAMLAVNPALFNFSRVALFEIALVAFIYCGFLFLMPLKPHRHMLAITILAGAGLLAGLTVKMSGIVYVIPACGALALAFFLDERFARFRTRKNMAVLAVLLVILLAVLFLARGIWGQRVAGGLYEVMATPQIVLWNNIAELSPFLLIAACLCIIHTIAERSEILKQNLFRLALAASVVFLPIMLNLFGYNPPRYSVAIIPAAVLLIADWLSRNTAGKTTLKSWAQLHVLEKLSIALLLVMITVSLVSIVSNYLIAPFVNNPAVVGKNYQLWAFPVIAVALLALAYLYRQKIGHAQLHSAIFACIGAYFVMSIGLSGAAIVNPAYDSQTVRQNLANQVSAGESVTGDWAAFFTAESRTPSLYMNWVFNRAEGIEKTRPTYFVFSDIWNDQTSMEIIQKNPNIALDTPVELGTYYGKAISLYRIRYATR